MSQVAWAQKTIFSISEVIDSVNQALEQDFQSVWLKGEISNFKAYPSGHYYFTLKDEKAQISAVMFKGYARSLKFTMENGLRVVVHGHLSIYEAQGKFQIQVDTAQPDGIGALQLAFEQLKQKLADEGLFDVKRKRPLPVLPRRIGVVTSIKGAVIRDIISVTQRRFPNMEILLYPVKVQGESSAEEIVNAINYFSAQKNVDVLIVGRGGGSLEDLWSFNEEIVARAIANCTIPVISAVGHETDITISDFVADLRAPTPSVAAECCVPVKWDLWQDIQNTRQNLLQKIRRQINSLSQELKFLIKSVSHPKNILERITQKIAELQNTLLQNTQQQITQHKHKRETLVLTINLLSPQTILKRGFAMIRDKKNQMITRQKQTHPEQELQINFYDGVTHTMVTQVQKKEQL